MASLCSTFSSLSLGAAKSSFLGSSVSEPASLQVPVGGNGVATAVVKRWEKKEMKPNGLPVRHKMHVKVGDTVKVITGKDAGKVSEIVRIDSSSSMVIVKDANLKTKHVKGKAEGEVGQIVQVEAAIHSSNVMLFSKEKQVASRVGHKVLENGTKVRYLLKTGEVIDSVEQWERIHKDKEEKK